MADALSVRMRFAAGDVDAGRVLADIAAEQGLIVDTLPMVRVAVEGDLVEIEHQSEELAGSDAYFRGLGEGHAWSYFSGGAWHDGPFTGDGSADADRVSTGDGNGVGVGFDNEAVLGEVDVGDGDGCGDGRTPRESSDLQRPHLLRRFASDSDADVALLPHGAARLESWNT